MRFKKYHAKEGDTLKINDSLALRFERFASDLQPVWHEVSAENGNMKYEDGTNVSVTDDVWFVFDKDKWRMMTPYEHIEADRQHFLDQY